MSTPLRVRDWEDGDMEKLADFHARMKVGYTLPSHFGPLFCIRKVVVDKDNNPVAFAAVKLVSEAFFWVDPDSVIPTRTNSLLMLHEECKKEALKVGLEETSCWIPDYIAKFFSKIIEKMGWHQSPWKSWTYLLK